MQPQGMFADPFAQYPTNAAAGGASLPPAEPFPTTAAAPTAAAPVASADPTAAAAQAPSFGGSTAGLSEQPASPKTPGRSSLPPSALSDLGAGTGAGGAGGNGSGAGGSSADVIDPPFPVRLQKAVDRQVQIFLDQSMPHLPYRWGGLALLMLLYCIRVYFAEGFYIVTYGLGIFLLNLFIGFLTPMDDGDGDPILPTNSREAGDEFKPFMRRLPEFKFWWSCTKAVALALFLTFFRVFDVPVFWPILLVYFIILFVLTMKRQIMHMWQHKYIPFSFGKPSYSSAAKGVTATPAKRAAN